MDGKQQEWQAPLRLAEILKKRPGRIPAGPFLFYSPIAARLNGLSDFDPFSAGGQFFRGIEVEKTPFVVEWHFDAPEHGLPFPDPPTTLNEKIFQAGQKVAPAQANCAVNLPTANRDGNVCTAFFERDSQSPNQIVRQKRSVAWYA